MILVFDGVSSCGYIGIYSDKREEIAHKSFHIAGNESSQAGDILHLFLGEHSIAFEDITDIVCIVGPGSFTGVRTITLVVNTLAFIYPHLNLTGISFFELYSCYPQIKSSSKRDLFVKWKKSDTIEIVKNEDFIERLGSFEAYGDISDQRFWDMIKLYSGPNYRKVLKNISLQKVRKLAPLYIKKPNIS